MGRLSFRSMLLLPAIASCQDVPPTNLRGAMVADIPTGGSRAFNGSLIAADEDEETTALNGTALGPSVQSRTCSATRKANQCLMARAKKANQLWGPWTRYANSDRHLTGVTSLKTDCSGFVNWALKGCIKNRLGERVLRGIGRSGPLHRTRAKDFYDAFGPSPPLGSSGKWCRVPDFRAVRRGDILVWDIPDIGPGKDTGHIMIAYRSPIEVGKISDGTLVFAQKVIDSSHKPHFDFGDFHDTRAACTEKCGVGVGYVYVFTNARGKILSIRLRGDKDRNAKKCNATSLRGKKKKIPIGCYSQSNHDRHRYRIGRLRL